MNDVSWKIRSLFPDTHVELVTKTNMATRFQAWTWPGGVIGEIVTPIKGEMIDEGQ